MDFYSFFQNYELFLRLMLAVFLGGTIGLERQLARKTAGLRTFSLVSLASCLIVIITNLIAQQSLSNFNNLAVIPANIITGIGFIGAGLIIFHGSHPSGITTAAGLLISAAVGMAVGFGFYGVAIFVAILTVLIFTVFWFFEEKFLDKFTNKVE